jgi:hypothetical protein
MLETGLLIAAGLALTYASSQTDLLGVGLLAVVVVSQLLRRRMPRAGAS